MLNQLPDEFHTQAYQQEFERRAAHDRLVKAAIAARGPSLRFYAPMLAAVGHLLAVSGVWLESRYSRRRHQHNVPGLPGYGQNVRSAG